MNSIKMEAALGEWANEFGRKVAEKYCSKGPRYSEMRSNKLRSYL